METNERYQIWLTPSGTVTRVPITDGVRLAPVGTIRHVKINPAEMDLEGGVILYDEDSVESVNMAATGLADLPSMTAIRGSVLFGILQEDGNVETVLKRDTADWVYLWAGDRCTVCGTSKRPVQWPAFPISGGKCCEKCDAVLRSVRQYMGIGSWKPKERK